MPNLLEEAGRGIERATYTSTSDAQDAIDNMDLNELRGKVIRVNLARPMKTPIQGMANNKASKLLANTLSMIFTHSTCLIQYGNQKNGLSNMRNHLLKVEVSHATFCYPLIYQQARL